MGHDEWDQEELFFSRREERKERKELSKKDRSKFKKSDRDQRKKNRQEVEIEGAKEGRVTSMISQDIFVSSEEKTYRCVLRGQIKKEKGVNKNLIVVGDMVSFTPLSGDEGVIEKVHPRTSYLSRAETYQHKKKQLIAANIDQVFITVSVVTPPLNTSIIDRYLIASSVGGMEPIILVNKTDLLKDHPEQEELLESIKDYYNENVAPLYPISTETGEGIDQVRELMKDKASVFSGPSGVGKSSIINKILDLDLPIGETVRKTGKGAHTTTQASLLPVPGGGWCIDTPGIKSFGLWNVDAAEVRDYFKDFAPYASNCRFPNCTHVHEPDCAVKEAAEEEKVNPLRYSSYLALLEEIDTPHKSR